MSNSLTHALPYPIRKARFALPIAFRVSAGTPTDPTTPDTEFSTDGGASFSDTAEEITTGGANGAGYLTLTGAETDNPILWIAAKSANCLTTPVLVAPRNLAIVGSGTLSAGSAGGGTLGTLLAYDVTGCFIRTTGGTGGGGTGGASNQARRIITYNTSTGAFTVSPNWETTPDNTTTYDVLLPEGVTLGMLKALNPTTAGRTLNVDTGNKAPATIAAGDVAADALTASALATDAVQEIRNAITGGAYALSTDANGRVRIVDGTAAGELDTNAGGVFLTSAGVQAIWDALTSALTTSGSIGKRIADNLDASVSTRLASASYTSPPSAATISAAVWAETTRILTAGTNIVLAKGTGVTGFNDIAAADVWAVGTRTLTGLGFTLGASDLASGILTAAKFAADALTASALATDAVQEIRNAITGGAYALDTDANGAIRIVDGTGSRELDTSSGLVALTAASRAAILTGTMTESYAADSAEFSVAQGLYAIHQTLMEFAIGSPTGTTWRVKKLDGSATAFDIVMNDATNPTSLSRAA